ncbi:MAG: hypothetical protein LUG21_00715 [Clostridiales bacterium]|nr:hypothetical protein [Clostridiales bacterium]
MEFRLGNSIKVKDKGSTVKLECPKCKNKVHFQVFTNMDTRITAEYPLLDVKTVYFLICPKCASIFTVDEDLGDEFQNGEKYSIGNFDLKPLNRFKK